MPRVGCWDCGARNPKYQRPKSVKVGMKHTVAVCKKCHHKWWREHS